MNRYFCCTKNEIDLIISNNKHIFTDVAVLNRFQTGSDHRLVRGTIVLNSKMERAKLVQLGNMYIPEGISERFEKSLEESLTRTAIEHFEDDFQLKYNRFMKILTDTAKEHFVRLTRPSAWFRENV